MPCAITDTSATVLVPSEKATARASIGSCTAFIWWSEPPER
jgi:hypothetical protein